MSEKLAERLTSDSKYQTRDGSVFLTGTQALVRLPMEQAWRDQAAGLRSGTIISGYPGSPLSGYDLALNSARKYLEPLNIHHLPAVNEELAAATVWGAHMADAYGGSTVDVTTGIWYAKNPGVGRCLDVFKTTNYGGLPPGGAVLAISGDNPMGETSSLPNQCESEFIACAMPVLFPGTVEELLSFGLHGIALSRFSSCWVGLKALPHLCLGGASVQVGPDRPKIEVPQVEDFPRELGMKFGPPFAVAMEQQLFEKRLPAAVLYARVNGLNRIAQRTPQDRIGIVAAGKTYTDLCQAFEDMGIGAGGLEQAGIRLLKIGMLYPHDGELFREFANGLKEIVVVEEKRDLLETALWNALRHVAQPPTVLGGQDETGARLFPQIGELDADAVTQRIGPFLLRRGITFGIRARLDEIATIHRRQYTSSAMRLPAYCSGCPHNRSTVRVEGEIVAGGIGCHGMATVALQEKRRVVNCGPMGSEGATWIGASKFASTDHLVQNLGDGTYAHSGSQGIRACVAAGVNITFKLLYNRTVAMTGGQDIVGIHDVPALAHALAAEGVRRINIVSERYEEIKAAKFPPNTRIFDRDGYEKALKQLLREKGVTVLINDQQCATEKRRLRKRGLQALPTKYVYINERVCEFCGDCGEASACMSLEPIMTEFGSKTRVAQTSCNEDYGCLKGDCPSFLTVYTKKGPRKPEPAKIEVPAIPEPVVPKMGSSRYRIYMVGVGGTGVVTANQVLAYAAMMDGLNVVTFDQAGFAQKGGSVLSSLVISPAAEPREGANKVGVGQADLMLAFDMLGAALSNNLNHLSPERSVVIGDQALQPTAEVILHRVEHLPALSALRTALDSYSGAANVWIEAKSLVENLLHDHMMTNTFLVGVAYQAGLLPLTGTSIEAALRVNGVSVDANLQAFRLGRLAQHDIDKLRKLAHYEPEPTFQSEMARYMQQMDGDRSAYKALLERTAALPEELRCRLAIRIGELMLYQDATLATRYLDDVLAMQAAEQQLRPGAHDLTMAVAKNLFKLMAYKDEYEVARLLLDPNIEQRVHDLFIEPEIKFNLHPPLLRSLGLKRKLEFGSWFKPILRLLTRMRRLRGTGLDLFGRTEMRRLDRELIAWYRDVIARVGPGLNEGNYAAAHAVLNTPERITGFERIRRESAARTRAEVEQQLADLSEIGGVRPALVSLTGR